MKPLKPLHLVLAFVLCSALALPAPAAGRLRQRFSRLGEVRATIREMRAAIAESRAAMREFKELEPVIDKIPNMVEVQRALDTSVAALEQLQKLTPTLERLAPPVKKAAETTKPKG